MGSNCQLAILFAEQVAFTESSERRRKFPEDFKPSAGFSPNVIPQSTNAAIACSHDFASESNWLASARFTPAIKDFACTDSTSASAIPSKAQAKDTNAIAIVRGWPKR